MTNVLFVCSCNTFRSAVAERIGNHYAKKLGKNMQFSSAGTNVEGKGLDETLVSLMNQIQVPIETHIARPVTAEMLTKQDFVIAMGEEHHTYLCENFGARVVLFNDMCFGRRASRLDQFAEVANLVRYELDTTQYFADVVTRIHEGFPKLLNKIPRYMTAEAKGRSYGFDSLK